eukprot:Platyproteum_vivax@DN7940_c0_g1_i1.p1
MDSAAVQQFALQHGFAPRPKVQLSPGVEPGTDFSKWQCIYPNYIDKTKKRKMGRRIPQESAVEEPTIDEMAEVCVYLNIPCVIEDKAYPRDWLVQGRLRVNLEPKGEKCSSSLKTELLLRLAELIPKLKSRNKPAPAPAGAAPSSASGGAGGKPNKKKKKK